MNNNIARPTYTSVTPEVKTDRWVLPAGEILEWDYEHGDFNKYDKKYKKYLGSFDKKTAKQTRPPVLGSYINKSKEEFYVVKYKKGFLGKLIDEKEIKIELCVLQNIFNIDPDHPEWAIRGMTECYNIKEKEAIALKSYVNFEFNFCDFSYEICGGIEHDKKNGKLVASKSFIIRVHKKNTPWRFVEECKLDVNLDFLRNIFKNDIYHSEPTSYGFEPKINLKSEYAEALQPYVPFKFELDKYDYWIEKRAEGEKRGVGQEGEEFVG